jgi:hypothetical protein
MGDLGHGRRLCRGWGRAVGAASRHPPAARTSLAGARPAETVDRLLRTVGDTLVAELGLEPGNVFVTFQEVAADRLYDASA